MATIDKAQTEAARTFYDFDPGATSLTEIAWVDMKNYKSFLAGFFRTIGTSDVVFKIIASDASDGTTNQTVIATHAFAGGQPDAVGDYIWLEVNSEEVQAGATADLRYVCVDISVATGTDEGVVYYELGHPNLKADGLTAESIA